MCYVVAKDRNKKGCYALKAQIGKHLSEYTRSLNESILREGIQIFVISRPTAYGEYAPYHFVDSEEREFWQCECVFTSKTLISECFATLNAIVAGQVFLPFLFSKWRKQSPAYRITDDHALFSTSSRNG